jgi:hypothetical protein
MKLSNDTIEVLKNFSAINQNILIKEGNTVRTMSTMKNILATADVGESFPREFGVYDLNEFLGVMSLTKDPVVSYLDNHMVINGGGSKIKYMYADPSILVTPPDVFNAPDTDINIKVLKETMATLTKASAVMQLPDLIIDQDGMRVSDLKNVTSNEFTQELDYEGENFSVNFKIENIKVIPGDYDVSISTSALVSNWKSDVVNYWIALEQPTD